MEAERLFLTSLRLLKLLLQRFPCNFANLYLYSALIVVHASYFAWYTDLSMYKQMSFSISVRLVHLADWMDEIFAHFILTS